MSVTRLVPRPRPAAIFDLDRTLLPGSSLVHVGRAAMQMGLVSARTLTRGLWEDARFRAQGSSDRQVESLHTRLLRMATGVDAEAMQAVVDAAAPKIVADMRSEVRALLDDHRDQGELIIILSASPEEVVAAVAAAVGADHGFGTRAEIVDGVISGRLVGTPCYGPGKLARMVSEGLPIDPARSSAYADSMSDLPILHAVNRPVVVSPDKALRRMAVAQEWPVLDPLRRPGWRGRLSAA